MKRALNLKRGPKSGACRPVLAAAIHHPYNHALKGVVALPIPTDVLDALQHDASGMGETGEAYLVGPDLVMRSDARLAEHGTRLVTTIRDAATEPALSGQPGCLPVANYRGEQVLSSFGPLEIPGGSWALIVDMAVAELHRAADAQRNLVILICLVGAVVISGLACCFARGLSRPVAELARSADQLAAGSVDQAVTISRGDELGDLARAFQAMIHSQRAKADFARQSGAGDLGDQAPIASDQDLLGHSMERMRSSILALTEDVRDVVQAAVVGERNDRSDLSRHQGAYRDLVCGLNDVVDALVGLSQMAKGNLDVAIRIHEVDDDTAEIGRNVERIHQAMDEMAEAIRRLTRGAIRLADVEARRLIPLDHEEAMPPC